MNEISNPQLITISFVFLMLSWALLVYTLVQYTNKIFKDPKTVTNKALFQYNFYFIGLTISSFIVLVYAKVTTDLENNTFIVDNGFTVMCAATAFCIFNRLATLPESHAHHFKHSKRVYVFNAYNMALISCIPSGTVFLGLLLN